MMGGPHGANLCPRFGWGWSGINVSIEPSGVAKKKRLLPDSHRRLRVLGRAGEEWRPLHTLGSTGDWKWLCIRWSYISRPLEVTPNGFGVRASATRLANAASKRGSAGNKEVERLYRATFSGTSRFIRASYVELIHSRHRAAYESAGVLQPPSPAAVRLTGPPNTEGADLPFTQLIGSPIREISF